MPTPKNTPITLPYGDTLSRLVTFYQDEEQTTPVDLSGFTALMVVFAEDGTVILMLTDSDGLTLGGVAGTIQIYSEMIEGTGTPIPPGCYSHYLRLFSESTLGPVREILIEGAFIVTPLGGE